MNKKYIISVIFLVTGTVFINATLDESPLEIIKARNRSVEEVLATLGDQIDDTTREQLKTIINDFIDFSELARLALGKHWQERTDQEKRDFTTVFQKLIRNSSVKKLEIYKADRIVYEPAEISGSKAKVTTTAHKKRKQVEILYKMHKIGDEWKVYDIEIDGASTARTYRESFNKQIAKSSYKEMYDKLVKRLSEDK